VATTLSTTFEGKQMPLGEVVDVRDVHRGVNETRHPTIEVVEHDFARRSGPMIKGSVGHGGQNQNHGGTLRGQSQYFVFGHVLGAFVVSVEVREVGDIVLRGGATRLGRYQAP